MGNRTVAASRSVALTPRVCATPTITGKGDAAPEVGTRCLPPPSALPIFLAASPLPSPKGSQLQGRLDIYRKYRQFTVAPKGPPAPSLSRCRRSYLLVKIERL